MESYTHSTFVINLLTHIYHKEEITAFFCQEARMFRLGITAEVPGIQNTTRNLRISSDDKMQCSILKFRDR